MLLIVKLILNNFHYCTTFLLQRQKALIKPECSYRSQFYAMESVASLTEAIRLSKNEGKILQIFITGILIYFFFPFLMKDLLMQLEAISTVQIYRYIPGMQSRIPSWLRCRIINWHMGQSRYSPLDNRGSVHRINLPGSYAVIIILEFTITFPLLILFPFLFLHSFSL